MANLQMHGLESVNMNIRPAGSSTSDPLTNAKTMANVAPVMPEVDGSLFHAPSGATGDFVRHTVASSAPSIGGKVTLEFVNLSYRDMALLGEIAFEGGVTATGGSAPYTWVHDGQSTTDDLARVNIQAGGGTLKKEMFDCVVSKLTITGNPSEGRWSASVELMGIKPVKVSSFDSPTDYSQGALMPLDENLVLYIDTAAGSIGTTQVTCDSIGQITITIDNNVSFVDTPCGREYGRGKRHMELAVTMNVTTATATVLQDIEDLDTLFTRLYVPDGSSPTHDWTLDIAGKGEFVPFGENGNFRSFTFVQMSEQDATLGYDWQSTIINDINAVTLYQS